MEFNLSIKPTKVPPWLSSDSNQFGLHHGRVPLNCVCNDLSSVRVQIRNPAQISELTLRFLNNNDETEHSVTITSVNDETFWTFNILSVPFIDRPLGEHPAEVSVTVNNFAYPLYVYKHNKSNIDNFKQTWSDSESTYALIDIENIVFLISSDDDKQLILANDFDLSSLFNFYDSVFAFYNNAIGLSHLTTDPVDKMYKLQYFCKINTASIVENFYQRNCMGSSNASLRVFLNINADLWPILTTISEGYVFSFGTPSPDLLRVWPNILANLYQYNSMTLDQRQNDAWIYNYGSGARVAADTNFWINSSRDFIAFPLRLQSLVYTLLTQHVYGKETFQLMYRQFRKFQIDNVDVIDYPIPDSLSNASQNLDCLPLFLLWQQNVVSKCFYNDNVKEIYTFERALSKLNRIAYPASKLLCDFDTETNNYGMPNLEFSYSLIFPLQTVFVDVILNLRINDFNQIVEDFIQIYDGTRLVHTLPVHKNCIQFSIGVGVYTMFVPRGRNKRYNITIPQNMFNERGNDCTNLYLIATNVTKQIDIMYTLKTQPDLVVRSVGYVADQHNALSVEFVVDTQKRAIKIKIFKRLINTFTFQIHRNNVLIRNIFVQGFNINNYIVVDYEYEDVLSIIKTQDLANNYFVFMNKRIHQLQTQYLLTENGVEDLNDQNFLNIHQQMRIKLVNDANFLNTHSFLLNVENSLKDNMLLMIKSLPDSNALMKKYWIYLPKHFQTIAVKPPLINTFLVIVATTTFLLLYFSYLYTLLFV